MNVATRPKITTWLPTTHDGAPTPHDKATIAIMERALARFAFLPMALWVCQFLITLPKTLCSNNQLWSLGEERANAKVATRRKTVVGISGKMTPMAPNATHKRPRLNQARRLGEYFEDCFILSIIICARPYYKSLDSRRQFSTR